MNPRALFLHGAGAWGGQWVIWRRLFEAEGWQVDAPDFEPAAGGLAATRFDDYVAQAVDAVEAAPVDVLVGASLGGLLAVAAMARVAQASRPRALVLVNPLPPAPWIAAVPPFTNSSDVVPWCSEGRFASTQRALPEAGFADQQLAFRHWRDESAAVLHEAHAGLPWSDTGVPTLLIASDADEAIPPAVSGAYAQGIGASLCRVPGGHVAPVMGPSAVRSAQAALAWLAPALSVP
ncbi:alpha/beta fold hydrolase [Silanimonas sp.]|uniref:alpha/beta fold hydrolase n=1 Tax=Silanimonas sp. TaxID=1929290 RepID=UPI0037C5E338